MSHLNNTPCCVQATKFAVSYVGLQDVEAKGRNRIERANEYSLVNNITSKWYQAVSGNAFCHSALALSRCLPVLRIISGRNSSSSRANSARTLARSRSFIIAAISLSRFAAWFNCKFSNCLSPSSEAEIRYSNGNDSCESFAGRGMGLLGLSAETAYF